MTFSRSLRNLLVKLRDSLDLLVPSCLCQTLPAAAILLVLSVTLLVRWYCVCQGALVSRASRRRFSRRGVVRAPHGGVPHAGRAQSLFVTYLPRVQAWRQSHLPPGPPAVGWLTAACLVPGSARAQKPCVNFCPPPAASLGLPSSQKRPFLLWWVERGSSPVQIPLGDPLFLLGASQWHCCFCPCPPFLPVTPAGLCATHSPALWSDLSPRWCVAPALWVFFHELLSIVWSRESSLISTWMKKAESSPAVVLLTCRGVASCDGFHLPKGFPSDCKCLFANLPSLLLQLGWAKRRVGWSTSAEALQRGCALCLCWQGCLLAFFPYRQCRGKPRAAPASALGRSRAEPSVPGGVPPGHSPSPVGAAGASLGPGLEYRIRGDGLRAQAFVRLLSLPSKGMVSQFIPIKTMIKDDWFNKKCQE